MTIPPHKTIATIGGTPVYQFNATSFIGWKSGLNIDADGSPHAYSPDGSPPGLDYLANAGSPGNWWGIVTTNNKSSGTPVIQGEGDPAPGFYVSCTSLQDPNYSYKSPLAWVDSETIPFIVLPGKNNFGGKMGDVATVVNLSSGVYCHAIAADVGPTDQIGEGSIALANALGIPSSPKSGGTSSGIGFLFYPGSGNGKPLTIDQINALAEPLFQQAMEGGQIDHLQQAPQQSFSSPSTSKSTKAPAGPMIVFNATTASTYGVQFQNFLNQFPGCSLPANGILGTNESAATARVLGFYLSGDPDTAPLTTGPYIVYDPKNRMDYSSLLETFLDSLPGVAVATDGLAGQQTSDASMKVFGHRLIGDPRDSQTFPPPTIPYDPKHFSTYAAQLQEFLNGLPGISLATDGYPGKGTSDALRQVIGTGLPEEPA